MPDIYLDNNATTKVDPEVVDAMLPFFTEQFGNPSSMHSFGDRVGKAIKRARQQVQELLGAQHDSEIIFTSCGTESDSTAIMSALKAFPERKELITTAVEHPAVLNLCEYLEKQLGEDDYVVHRLAVDSKGRIDLKEYKKLLSPRTAIVSAMWANNETGTLFPVEEMAEFAHAQGALFHTDAVQVVGKTPINLKATAIDMLSVSGHKLHARSLCETRNAVSPDVARRSPGTRSPRRHGKHRVDRRPGQGLRAGAGTHVVRKHVCQGHARSAGTRNLESGAARLRHRRS